jgi:hypothetical protein
VTIKTCPVKVVVFGEHPAKPSVPAIARIVETIFSFMVFPLRGLAGVKKKRAHLLAPQVRHGNALEGTLSARPGWGVLQVPSFNVKFPVSTWTAAEAANFWFIVFLVCDF